MTVASGKSEAMGHFTDKITKPKGSSNGAQPPGGSRDLWPTTTVFALRDASTEAELAQSVTVTSLPVACTLGVCDIDDFKGQQVDDLCLMICEEPDAPDGSEGLTTTFIVNREDLLRHTIGLMQRLVADIGPARAREVFKTVGGYPLHTMGDA